jgi:hypothetical protein
MQTPPLTYLHKKSRPQTRRRPPLHDSAKFSIATTRDRNTPENHEKKRQFPPYGIAEASLSYTEITEWISFQEQSFLLDKKVPWTGNNKSYFPVVSYSPFLLARTGMYFLSSLQSSERPRSMSHSRYNLATSSSPSYWRHCVSPKCRYPPTKRYVETTLKTIWVFTTVKIWGFLLCLLHCQAVVWKSST